MGGLASSFNAASRVSLDDEESMGTIDELPTMMGSFQQQPPQQQQQSHHHLLGEEQEELAVAAV